MPLPDATPDKRIYELLKTVDLENLSFADFQGVAKTIYAEQGAEDELRRIVLVNLARLAVKGNWDGLTSSGGSSEADRFPLVDPTTYSRYTSLAGQITAGNGSELSLAGTSFWDGSMYYPFVGTFTGNLSEIKFNINTAAGSTCDLKVGIYTSENGVPKTLLGSASIAVTSTGDKALTSFSSTIALVRGTQYYIGFVRSATVAVGISAITINSSSVAGTGFGYFAGATTSQTNYNIIHNDEDDNNLPSTVTNGTNLTGLGRPIPTFMIK